MGCRKCIEYVHAYPYATVLTASTVSSRPVDNIYGQPALLFRMSNDWLFVPDLERLKPGFLARRSDLLDFRDRRCITRNHVRCLIPLNTTYCSPESAFFFRVWINRRSFDESSRNLFRCLRGFPWPLSTLVPDAERSTRFVRNMRTVEVTYWSPAFLWVWLIVFSVSRFLWCWRTNGWGTRRG